MKFEKYIPAGALVCATLNAGPLTINSVSATQTQIVVNYTAPSVTACTISVLDRNGGTNPPHDVDPALFPNSDSDLGRTTANGFRWPTMSVPRWIDPDSCPRRSR